MDDIEEFAVEYTGGERKRIVVLGIVVGAVVVLLGKTWLFPWFVQFTETAHCRSFLGHSGTEIVFFGVFVGVPVLGLLPLLNLTWTGYRVLQDGQVPPKGTKVMQKTRIVRGRRATRKGVFLLLIVPVLGLPFVTWGYFQAVELAKNVKGYRGGHVDCSSIRASQAG